MLLCIYQSVVMSFEASTWSSCLCTVYYMVRTWLMYAVMTQIEYFGVINVFNAQNIVRD